MSSPAFSKKNIFFFKKAVILQLMAKLLKKESGEVQ